MRATDVLNWILGTLVLTAAFGIVALVLLNAFVQVNEVHGRFTSVCPVNFVVLDSPICKPLVFTVEVSYNMTSYDDYPVRVIVKHSGADVLDQTLVIQATSTYVQMESASTEVDVPEPGSYIVTFYPQGYQRSIDYSIEQPPADIFNHWSELSLGMAAVISLLIVWLRARSREHAPSGTQKLHPSSPPSPS